MVVVGGDVQRVLFVSTVFFDPVHDHADRIVNIQHGSKHIVHVVGVCGPVDIALLVHHEETVVVLGKELKSLLDVLLDGRDLFQLFWFVVVAEFIWGGEVDTNGQLGIGVDDLFAGRAPSVGECTVYASVGHVTLSARGEISADADENVIAIVRVQILNAVVKVLGHGHVVLFEEGPLGRKRSITHALEVFFIGIVPSAADATDHSGVSFQPACAKLIAV
mmetsp:Transcript_92428/g.138428  ORF Transcript_92428/g.138428 Transcript_92428/m.138428 type:complete len:220 (-) Transcript_92428:487-1146(-)